MNGIMSNSGGSPFFGWITDDWLRSNGTRRFLFWIASIHVACLLPFFLFMPSARPWLAGTLQHLAGRIALGLDGAIGALTAIVLVNCMKRYWQDVDGSPKPTKKLWFWLLTLGVNIGACAYCFLVYLPQRRDAGRNG
jgi:formate hydrogenlyase subunit 3/multisubunit Na+/H+ antiporter MnhD subunit